MSWQPTAALARVTVLPAAIALVAVLARRVDLLVLAIPLGLAALPLLRRPTGRPTADVQLDDAAVQEGSHVGVIVQVRGAQGAEAVAVGLDTPGWVAQPGHIRAHAAGVVGPDGKATLRMGLPAERWGRSTIGPGWLTCTTAGGLLRWGPLPLPARRAAVHPLADRYRAASVIPRTGGGIGNHQSRRGGDSSELAGIRPFGPGDRLRRINWRVSLRSDELQVNATTSERDTEVVLLVDARYDAGTSGGVHGQVSGVDTAIRAAASIGEFYLHMGDRVGLVVAGDRLSRLPARAGRAHLPALLGALVDVQVAGAGAGEPRLPPLAGIDAGALIVILSPLVGTSIFDQAAALGRSGHPVLAVDTLPDDAAPATTTAWTAPVLRLWRLERATRIRQLTALGVPVVPWAGGGSLDHALQDLTRAANSARRGP